MDKQQDERGPLHAPVIEPGLIAGVSRQSFPTVRYLHGALTELVNARWADMFTEPVEHLYLVENAPESARDEWYLHERTRDRYVLLRGAMQVALFDDRSGSETEGVLETFDLDGVGEGASLSGLVIPPGVWHSFRSKGDRMLLLNAKSPAYDRENPDKYRLPMPNERTSFTWE